MKQYLYNIFDFATSLLIVLIFVRIVLSWFRSAKNAYTAFIWEITDPLLAPFKRIIPKTAVIDFSPLLLLITIEIIRSLVLSR